MKKLIKNIRFERRNKRVRFKIFGTNDRPRLVISKSNIHIYAQIIDDNKMVTLVSSSDLKIKKNDKMSKVQIAQTVGELLAKEAITKKIKSVVFDRNGFLYHGRVKALADGARKGGLEF